jgi:hypothetical protein
MLLFGQFLPLMPSVEANRWIQAWAPPCGHQHGKVASYFPMLTVLTAQTVSDNGEVALFYRDGHKDAGPVTDRSRDMALTYNIVSQINITRTEASLATVADLNFTFA